jgi:phosphoribosyl 1,2-cyclic phosphodiesterase
MKLKTISTGSVGNCYILTDNENESLIIECGVKFKDIKKALNFDLSNVAGCIVSHSHNDHCLSLKDLFDAGIKVYANKAIFKKVGITENPEINDLFKGVNQFKIGSKWTIMTFPLVHDVSISGFLIHHKESGKILFATDTSEINYNFKVNNIIIEANYSEKLIENSSNEWLTERIKNSHFSIEKCIDYLSEQDLSEVNNILLIHLSDRNSSEQYFKELFSKSLGVFPKIAENGQEIEFNLDVFCT